MDEDDLERLGDQLAEDEGVTSALEEFDMTCRYPMRIEWLITGMADEILNHDQEELQYIGRLLKKRSIDDVVTIILGMSILTEGYSERFTGPTTDSDDEHG